ncbi:MAG TPA: class I SAM-dependent methyltransferase [Methylomirabilota bacterium]|nr:class I SAM-dependent methyltransferase [Methylomirabilota bacterium]
MTAGRYPEPRAAVFDDAAVLYDEVRPGYAPAIVDAIIAGAGLPGDGRILEIGCGTGQMTLPFAMRGYSVLALEPGDALAALAGRNCRGYPRVTIEPISFEAWPAEPGAFDLVLSAQAFHWIEPESGFAKTAVTLRPGGTLALVWYIDVSQDTPFWKATQPIYDRYLPGAPSELAGDSLAETIDRYRRALGRSDSFEDLRETRQASERAYTGAAYLKLLTTFSNHRALPEPDRTAFFTAIAGVVERHGGPIRRKYETILLLARRGLRTGSARPCSPSG